MKKFLFIVFAIFFFCNSIFGFKKIDVPFKVGEYLEFEVKLFNTTVAIQKIWVKGIVTVRGKKCYHLHADIETVGWVSSIYHLHDIFDEYIELDTLRPIRIKAKKKEGKWTNTVQSEIFRKEKYIHYTDTRHNHNKKIPYKGDLVGMVSILFFARTFTPEKNEKLSILLSVDDKLYPITVVTMDTHASLYIKKLKKKFKTFFYQQIGGRNVALWISNDKRRLPVRLISVKLKLAGRGITSVEAWLRKYK